MAVRKPFSGVEEWFDHSARGFLNHLPRVIRARQEEKGLSRRVSLDQFPTPPWPKHEKSVVERIGVRPGVRQHGDTQDALNRAAAEGIDCVPLGDPAQIELDAGLVERNRPRDGISPREAVRASPTRCEALPRDPAARRPAPGASRQEARRRAAPRGRRRRSQGLLDSRRTARSPRNA